MKVLVTGGAGFIGTHLARHLSGNGDTVAALDNLSRRGSELNISRLDDAQVKLFEGDVRDMNTVDLVMRSFAPDIVYHLAAQVAVTTSVDDPRLDFSVNALGALNVLEAARQYRAAVMFTSTNKVYGGLENISVIELEGRYQYADHPLGISEDHPLDFHSPYGCSKGAADQYVLDYARIYGMATMVFRMSCIYGSGQFGNEDQGWLAHFAIAAALGRPITIYGDGRQVRDVLYVDDLLSAFDRARARLAPGVGQVFNIGGGPRNTLAIWTECGPLLEQFVDHPIVVEYKPARPGDQKIYVSNIRKAERDLDWHPVVDVHEGLGRLCRWVTDSLTTVQETR